MNLRNFGNLLAVKCSLENKSHLKGSRNPLRQRGSLDNFLPQGAAADGSTVGARDGLGAFRHLGQLAWAGALNSSEGLASISTFGHGSLKSVSNLLISIFFTKQKNFGITGLLQNGGWL